MNTLWEGVRPGDRYADNNGRIWKYSRVSPRGKRVLIFDGVPWHFSEDGLREISNDIRLIRRIQEPVFMVRVYTDKSVCDWYPCPRDEIIRKLQAGHVLEVRIQS